MAKKLVVGINMFSMNQSIYELHEDGKVDIVAATALDRLGEAVCSLIDSSNEIEEIELDGPTEYIEKYGFEILEELAKNYSDRNVRLNLNGKVFN